MNVSTKGILDETGTKHFAITNKDTGEVHMAIRSGQKFELGEFRGTLKECKEIVAAGKVVHFADAPIEADEEVRDLLTPAASPQLLLAYLAGGNAGDSGEILELIKECLDCNGLWDHDKDGPESVSVEIDLALKDFRSDKRIR